MHLGDHRPSRFGRLDIRRAPLRKLVQARAGLETPHHDDPVNDITVTGEGEAVAIPSEGGYLEIERAAKGPIDVELCLTGLPALIERSEIDESMRNRAVLLRTGSLN